MQSLCQCVVTDDGVVFIGVSEVDASLLEGLSESGGTSQASAEALKNRRIRSFVRREGRVTRGQQRALDGYWEKYGIDFSAERLNLDALFGRNAPKVLEIGFGMGHALIDMAQRQPENDYLGIEVYQSGVGHVLSQVESLALTNVRVSQTDAVDVLNAQLPLEAFERVCLFFPDPWHKKKHHKRRLVQPEFMRLVYGCLKEGGVFHVATDWEDYAYHILEVLSAAAGFENKATDGGFIPRPEDRILTKFERRGQGLGHQVFDMKFYKKACV